MRRRKITEATIPLSTVRRSRAVTVLGIATILMSVFHLIAVFIAIFIGLVKTFFAVGQSFFFMCLVIGSRGGGLTASEPTFPSFPSDFLIACAFVYVFLSLFTGIGILLRGRWSWYTGFAIAILITLNSVLTLFIGSFEIDKPGLFMLVIHLAYAGAALWILLKRRNEFFYEMLDPSTSSETRKVSRR